MRKRHRFNRRMTRIVLLISFLFLDALSTPPSAPGIITRIKASQESTLTAEPPPASNPLILMPDTPLSAGRDARFRGTIPDEACFAADDL